jgi:hypothetical protein
MSDRVPSTRSSQTTAASSPYYRARELERRSIFIRRTCPSYVSERAERVVQQLHESYSEAASLPRSATSKEVIDRIPEDMQDANLRNKIAEAPRLVAQCFNHNESWWTSILWSVLYGSLRDCKSLSMMLVRRETHDADKRS